jgi:hypothetical protein
MAPRQPYPRRTHTETPFTETEALLKVMHALDVTDEDVHVDYTEVKDYLRTEFLPNELRKLAVAADQLNKLAWTAYDEVSKR